MLGSDLGGRRTVAELVTLYTLEPELRDIFVEGRTDRAFLEWQVSQVIDNGLIRVYAVSDRVEIPDEMVVSAGYLTGERGRVLTLAEELSSLMPEHSSALMIADKDFASLGADRMPQLHGLLYTDYSSMEAYAFNEDAVSKVLKVGLGAPSEINAEALLSAIAPALVSLFVIRLCLRESQTGVTLAARALEKWKLSEPKSDEIEGIFRGALNKLPATERNGFTPEALSRMYFEYRGKLGEDVRHYINGHDVSYLIIRYLKNNCANVFNADRRRAFTSAAMLETLLMSCVESAHFRQNGLFRSIEEWASLR